MMEHPLYLIDWRCDSCKSAGLDLPVNSCSTALAEAKKAHDEITHGRCQRLDLWLQFHDMTGRRLP